MSSSRVSLELTVHTEVRSGWSCEADTMMSRWQGWTIVEPAYLEVSSDVRKVDDGLYSSRGQNTGVTDTRQHDYEKQ